MEVLEINEQLMDADGRCSCKIKIRFENLQKSIYEPVKQIVEHYQEGVTSEKELLQVKEYYYKKKYLHRIEQQLKAMS
jgi:molecular chaperone HscB